MWLFRTSVFILTAVSLPAQHSYTPGDVRDGERLYLVNCAVCHGPEGNMVPGTDLGHGAFRRASTDEGLAEIVRKGIPGTAMPPHNFSNFQAMTIVAFLRSMSAGRQSSLASGDAARGKAIFEGAGNCRSCHRVGAAGSRLGPDLTDIGVNRRAAELESSLLDPDAEVLPQNRFVRGVLKDGTVIDGRLLNQDAFTVQLMDSKERLQSLRRADLREFSFAEKSLMPSYRDKFTAEQRADVVAYLVSLRGIGKQ